MPGMTEMVTLRNVLIRLCWSVVAYTNLNGLLYARLKTPTVALCHSLLESMVPIVSIHLHRKHPRISSPLKIIHASPANIR